MKAKCFKIPEKKKEARIPSKKAITLAQIEARLAITLAQIEARLKMIEQSLLVLMRSV